MAVAVRGERGPREIPELPGRRAVAALIREAGGLPPPDTADDSPTGYSVALAAPHWALAVSGSPARAMRRAAVALPEVVRLQALLLMYLQDVDDEVDGRPRGVGARAPDRQLAAARERLAELVGQSRFVWNEFDRLLEAQEEAARWELSLRGRPYARARVADLARIEGRIALLRAPAAVIAHLLGDAALHPRLDAVSRSLLLAALLMDDLSDIVEDAQGGCCNAVLLAGRARLSPRRAFLSDVREGIAFVSAWIATEVDALRAASRGVPGSGKVCAALQRMGREATEWANHWTAAAQVASALDDLTACLADRPRP